MTPEQLLPLLIPKNPVLPLETKLGAFLDRATDLLGPAEIGIWAFVAACASVVVFNLFLRAR